jgi:hypothetical protein
LETSVKISRQKRGKITTIIEEFIIRVHELMNLPVDEVVVNPFLAAALGLKKRSEILEFFLMQRLQRGIVTSFGSVVQEIAKTLDAEAHEEDIDLVFERNGTKHYVQLKSGPEGFTRPALRKTRAAFQKLKTRNPSCVTVIGFSYGTRAQLSPVWGREAYESADRVLVGREFWDFFAGDGFYNELIRVFQSLKPRVGKGQKRLRRLKFKQIYKLVYQRLLMGF